MAEYQSADCTEYPEFPWESQYQYRCRVYKIKQYTETLGLMRAVALANVWANFHFLGCSYPSPVLESIKDWEPPPRNKELEEKLAELQRLEKEAMYDKSLVNQNLNLRDLKFRLYHSSFQEQPPPVVLIYNSSQACKVPCFFVDNDGTVDGMRTVSLYINDIHVSDGRAANLKEAKHACAENALKFLKKKGLVVVSPLNIDEDAIGKVSKASLTDKKGNMGEDYEENKIEEDNVGCKLLKAMGWSSDTGLGKDGQGRVNPISTIGQLNRGGLGSNNSEAGICHQSVKQQLLSFLRNPDLMKLEFSSELDNLERKMIHRLSGKYGLKHKSRGSGSDRKLVVWKEETLASEVLAEPVIQFEEEDIGDDFEMVDGEVREPDTEDTTRANLHSLSLDPLVEGETNIVNNYRGKRKMPVTSTHSKITKTTNVNFDYNSVNNRKPMVSGHVKPYRYPEASRNLAGNSDVRTKGRQKRTDGPFREGYVDPYVSGLVRETYRRADYETDQNSRTTYRRTTYRRPDFPQSHSSHGSARGLKVDGYVGDLCRDPRTHHSSGFGIYRHMKPRTRK